MTKWVNGAANDAVPRAGLRNFSVLGLHFASFLSHFLAVEVESCNEACVMYGSFFVYCTRKTPITSGYCFFWGSDWNRSDGNASLCTPRSQPFSEWRYSSTHS